MMVHVHRASAEESQMSHRLRRWIFINCLFWLLSILYFPFSGTLAWSWHKQAMRLYDLRRPAQLCSRKSCRNTSALFVREQKDTRFHIATDFRSWWWRWSQLPKILTKISLCFAAWQCARVVSQVEAWERKIQMTQKSEGGTKKITKVN